MSTNPIRFIISRVSWEREKIEAELAKVKAERLCETEKLKAGLDSDGMTKELIHVQSEIKKDVKIAKAEVIKKIN